MSVNGVRPITEVAADLGVDSKDLLLFGTDKAKIRLEARDNGREPGRLILVSAITPTNAGEGKTTTSIGLAQGLAKIGESVCLALREPSLGPTFGRKGGATGGGRSNCRIRCRRLPRTVLTSWVRHRQTIQPVMMIRI